jgi:hypothetical protein
MRPSAACNLLAYLVRRLLETAPTPRSCIGSRTHSSLHRLAADPIRCCPSLMCHSDVFRCPATCIRPPDSAGIDPDPQVLNACAAGGRRSRAKRLVRRGAGRIVILEPADRGRAAARCLSTRISRSGAAGFRGMAQPECT